MDSENCDPKRLTSRQQLAYIALKASKGLGSEIGNQIIKCEATNETHGLPEDSLQCLTDDSLTESKENIFKNSNEQRTVEKIIKVTESICASFPESVMMNDLNEIAERPMVCREELVPEESPEKDSEALESELHFLSHDVADFIRSTNDVQRLRSDILESERRNRLTSGY